MIFTNILLILIIITLIGNDFYVSKRSERQLGVLIEQMELLREEIKETSLDFRR